MTEISAVEFAASEAVWLDLSREMADEMRAEHIRVDAWYEDFKRAVGYCNGRGGWLECTMDHDEPDV